MHEGIEKPTVETGESVAVVVVDVDREGWPMSKDTLNVKSTISSKRGPK